MCKGKTEIAVIITLCVSLFCFCRYQIINKNVPKSYEKQQYSVGETINLDNLQFKVKSYKINELHNKDNINVLLILNIKNVGKNKVDASSILFNSKLATEFQYEDVADIKKDHLNYLKNLKPNDELNVQLTYSLRKTFKNNHHLRFYIANKLYKNNIIEKYKDQKFYSKYVYLKN